MKIAESELIINGDGSVFHLHLRPEELADNLILVGDPGRVESIASYFDDAKQVAYNREYNLWTGYLLGEKVSVCSTGIGGPSASIAVEELHQCGADTCLDGIVFPQRIQPPGQIYLQFLQRERI